MQKKVPFAERNVEIELHLLDCGGFDFSSLTSHWTGLTSVFLVYDGTDGGEYLVLEF